MKKFLTLLFTAFVFVVNMNSQNINARIGVTAVLEPTPIDVSYFNCSSIGGQYGLSLGVGETLPDNIYIGIGLDISGYSLSIRTNKSYYGHSVSETTTEFMMPVYGELAYIKPHNWYGSFKIGAVFENYESDWVTNFYMNITPLGYTFDSNISCGLGYRMISGHGYTTHGISFEVKYNF